MRSGASDRVSSCVPWFFRVWKGLLAHLFSENTLRHGPLSAYKSSTRAVLKYRSAALARIITSFFPAFSGRATTWGAAQTVAPLLPAGMPSYLLLRSASADAEALSAKTNAHSLFFYFLSWSEMEFMQ